jgi:nucleotide-binding universal stress UspA family protein
VLIDYATMNDAKLMLIGAPRKGGGSRLFGGVCAQIVAEAPCSVSVVRPQPEL